MGFYVIVHILLGVLAGASANSVMKARSSPPHYPMWLQGAWVPNWAMITCGLALIAIVTSLFQWGIVYSLLTIGELIFGALLAGFMPRSMQVLATAVGPIITILMMGAVWGWWRI